MKRLELENRDPDLKIDRLSIWILGRQFEGSTDYYDGNWLNVVAICDGENSKVKADGPILMVQDILKFAIECKEIDKTLSGSARLHSYEPNLDFNLSIEKTGKMDGEIEITPDHMSESHRYTISIDQSYLRDMISQCDEILTRFPVRGKID